MLLALILATLLRGPADVETLAREADAVVHARVVRTSASSAHGIIATTVVLTAVETWKGGAGGEVTVVVEGGCAGDYCQTVEGTPAFAQGEEVVVFLKARGPVFEVSRWALGKFGVGAALPSLPKRALRDRSGLTCVGCGADEQDDLSLEELHARVARSVRQ